MDVQINHQHLADRALRQQPPRGHRHVVEHAEARPGVGLGVVAAAGGVAGDPVRQRQAGGRQGAADRRLGAPGH